MLTELGFENFKVFERATLNTPRITVLIGQNGAGKSSVLQGLQVLKQSRQQSKLVLNGPYTEAGEYADTVTLSAVRKRMGFRLRIEAPLPQDLVDGLGDHSFLCTYHLSLDSFDMVSHRAQFDLPRSSFEAQYDFKQRRGAVSPERPIEGVDMKAGSLVCIPLFVTSQSRELYEAARALRDGLDDLLRNTFIVPTERALTARSYAFEPVGSSIDFVRPEQVAGAFAYQPAETRDKLSRWLEALLGEQLQLEFKLEPPRQVKIETYRSHLQYSCNIADEGAGLQHILWPLAQIAAAPSGSLIGSSSWPHRASIF